MCVDCSVCLSVLAHLCPSVCLRTCLWLCVISSVSVCLFVVVFILCLSIIVYVLMSKLVEIFQKQNLITEHRQTRNTHHTLMADSYPAKRAISGTSFSTPAPFVELYFKWTLNLFVQCKSKHVYGICCKTVMSSAFRLYN